MIKNDNYLLITNADVRTWQYDRPTLCLGAWCRNYDNSEKWANLNPSILPYHWEDRDKLYKDYRYLHKVYESLLNETSSKLNELHGTVYSTRYWRILIGPWLLYFTEMLFDRWESIQAAINRYNITSTIILDFPPEMTIPKTMYDFRNKFVSDEWNHAIFAKIITGWTNIAYDYIKHDEQNTIHPTGTCRFNRYSLGRIRGFFTNLLLKTAKNFSRETDAVLVATYLPFFTDFLLQLSLKQIPIIHHTEAAPNIGADLQLRNSIQTTAKNFEGFENCIRTLLFQNIPTLYLEGYYALREKVKKLKWPKKPKIIFTSVAYNSDDVFKAWAAQCVEEKSHLIIGQHGGALGSSLISSSRDHELAISDRYLTWGWTLENPKQYPVGILKQLCKRKARWNPSGLLLLVTSVMPRYSYILGSYPVSTEQTEKALNDNYIFVQELNREIYKLLRVRLFLPDWGWNQSKRWTDIFPDIILDSGKSPMEASLKKARLVVVVYNGTVLLETMSQNIPTIIFWDQKYNELHPDVVPYFILLEDVGIFHKEPVSAARKVQEIWNNVEMWWKSKKVQDARNAFCAYMAKKPRNPISVLKNSLKITDSNLDSQKHLQI
ncbi:MAG: hypothetical protein HQK53_00995 [Oligoflexia bacterium]|nr:hypothetical protein [Oligoflexia bacterium]